MVIGAPTSSLTSSLTPSLNFSDTPQSINSDREHVPPKKRSKMCNSSYIPDLTQKIGHTNLTVQWLLDTLKETCVNFQRFSKLDDSISVTWTRIGQDQGNNSSIYLICLKFHEINKSLRYCIKTARPQEHDNLLPGMKRLFDSSRNKEIHNRECEFYEEFGSGEVVRVPKILKIEKMKKDEDLEGCILMEYMGKQSSIIPLGHSFTKEQVFSVFDEISRLHAYSLANYDELFEKIGEFGMKHKHNPKFAEIMQKNHQLMVEKLEKEGGDSVDFLAKISLGLQKLGKYMDRMKFGHFTSQKFHKLHNIPSVLVHGDLWGNNILMETGQAENEDENDGILNTFQSNNVLAILDWQFFGYANPCTDLCRFFIMNLSPEMRKELKEDALEFYHTKLHEHLREMKKSDETLENKELFSMEQLREVFDATLVAQMGFAAFIGLKFMDHAETPQHKNAYLRNLVCALEEVQKIVDEQSSKWNYD